MEGINHPSTPLCVYRWVRGRVSTIRAAGTQAWCIHAVLNAYAGRVQQGAENTHLCGYSQILYMTLKCNEINVGEMHF